MRGPRIWFDPPVFRWSRVLVIAAAGVAGVVGWLAHKRGVWPEEPPRVTAAASAAAAAPPIQAPSAVVTRRGSPAPVAAASRAEATRTPTVAAVRDGCAVGAAKDAAASDASAPSPVQGARARWFAALAASPDAAVRAAGLLWEARAPASSGPEAARASARDRLARLAVDSTDPLVYAFAMNACDARQGASPAGACQLLSTGQWARIDPGNAAVWLAVAERAGLGTPAQAEALQRAAQAGELKLRWAELLPLVRRAEPAGLADPERLLLAREVIAVQAASPAPIGGAADFCSRVRVQDANRRGECEQLAALFLERGEVLGHLVAGRALAESLGWPADRLAALRRESEALAGAVLVPAGEAPACEALERQVERALEAARIGEVAALRQELKRAGKAVDERAASRQ